MYVLGTGRLLGQEGWVWHVEAQHYWVWQYLTDPACKLNRPGMQVPDSVEAREMHHKKEMAFWLESVTRESPPGCCR